MINELHVLLKNLNHEGRSGRLMENMVDASAELKRLASETRQALSQVRGEGKEQNRIRETLNHLNSILAKVDRGEGTLGALINDPSLHQKLISIVGESPRRQYLKRLIRDSQK